MRLIPSPDGRRLSPCSGDRRPRHGAVTPPRAAVPRAHRTRFPALSPSTNAAVTPPMSSPPVRRRSIVRWRLVVTIALVILALVLSASAACAETTQVLALAGSVDQVLTNIRNWVMGILAGLATVFLSIGGVRYVMGGGDPGEIEKAKTAFKAAGIGYGLAALAPLVVTVLQGIVGGP